MSEPLRRLEEPEEGDRPGFQARARDAARREHALQSVLELSRELRVSLDLHETADLLLFNLMGQVGSARAALWLLPEDGDGAPVLVRAHGFRREGIEAVGELWSERLLKRFRDRPSPVLAWALGQDLDAGAFELLRNAEVALFAPLQARDELLGWLALGERLDGSAYAPEDLQVVEAARGMVAVSIQNARLYNRTAESNRALRAANEHLHELDRLKTEFLSNVNHELRTPLAVVLASLELLSERPGAEPTAQKLMTSALGQARKLDKLIQKLLTFSDVRNATPAIRVAPDEVTSVLGVCVAERQPGVSASLRQLVYEPVGHLPRACFDRPRVRQILDELIDNAVKFTPRGSRITIGARAVSVDGTDWVRITVSDDGPGIAPEKMGSLFSSFEQGDGSATRTVGGLGMGLALARTLAEKMGGRLEVERDRARGAAFRLELAAE